MCMTHGAPHKPKRGRCNETHQVTGWPSMATGIYIYNDITSGATTGMIYTDVGTAGTTSYTFGTGAYMYSSSYNGTNAASIL